MKISLNIKFNDGPAGGGMKFANLFLEYLKKKGVKVINDLNEKNIDIIFHISPAPILFSTASYSFLDAYAYKLKNPKTLIVHRINECDERKKTHHVNNIMVKTSKYSDAIIFIAEWLKPLLVAQGLNISKPNRTILHGADHSIFNTIEKKFWNHKRKMRLVTHHWGANYMKGHDIYQQLDDLLDTKKFKDKFEFTFIGNYPKDLNYKNTKIIPPLGNKDLGIELKRHDIYITASRNEPAGMHHVEGALCGLPVLYIDSGSLKEYNEDYGIEFNKNNFKDKILEVYNNYKYNLNRVLKYDRTAEKMLNEYYIFLMELRNNNLNHNNSRNNLKSNWFKVYSTIHKINWKFKKYFKMYE